MPHRAYCLCWSLLAGLAFGCATKPQAVQPNAEPRSVVLPIQQEHFGQDGPYVKPLRLVIRNEPELLNAKLGELKVNFDEQMVLLVALGKVDNDAYLIRITEVREEKDRVLVITKLWAPTKETPGEHRAAYPWTAVVVPRSDKPVDRFAADTSQIGRRGYNPFR